MPSFPINLKGEAPHAIHRCACCGVHMQTELPKLEQWLKGINAKTIMRKKARSCLFTDATHLGKGACYAETVAAIGS